MNDSNNFFSFYPYLTKEARNDIAHLKGDLSQYLWIFGACLKTVYCSEDNITKISYLFVCFNEKILLFFLK